MWLWMPRFALPRNREDNVLRTVSNLSDTFCSTPAIENHSLTAILPIFSHSLQSLEVILSPFLVPTDIIRDVLLLCPQKILSDARRVLKSVLSYNNTADHPNISLVPYTSSLYYTGTFTSVATRVGTEWVLILDDRGFEGLSSAQRAYLLNPLSISLPVGPKGFVRLPNNGTISVTGDLEPADYLIPPLVAPTDLFPRTFSQLADSDPWLFFGSHVAKTHLEMIGGLVLPADPSGLDCCEHNYCPALFDRAPIEYNLIQTQPSDSASSSGHFALVIPHLEDLHAFMTFICRFKSVGHTVSTLLYQESSRDAMHYSYKDCALDYSTLSRTTPTFDHWLESLNASPDIVFALDVQDFLTVTLTMALLHDRYRETTLIRLPRTDLPYSDWIGSLALRELRSQSRAFVNVVI